MKNSITDILNQYRSMKEHNIDVDIKWNEYASMKIDRVSRHGLYIEFIAIDNNTGELHYVKCTYKEFANLIIDGGY